MKLADLFEVYHPASLDINIKDTLPPSYVLPQLKNTDPYVQYRYVVALATAKAIEDDNDFMPQESAWNENEIVVCYTPQEEEIMKLANKHMGVKANLITTGPSHEPPFVNKVSAVRKFKDYE